MTVDKWVFSKYLEIKTHYYITQSGQTKMKQTKMKPTKETITIFIGGHGSDPVSDTKKPKTRSLDEDDRYPPDFFVNFLSFAGYANIKTEVGIVYVESEKTESEKTESEQPESKQQKIKKSEYDKNINYLQMKLREN